MSNTPWIIQENPKNWTHIPSPWGQGYPRFVPLKRQEMQRHERLCESMVPALNVGLFFKKKVDMDITKATFYMHLYEKKN